MLKICLPLLALVVSCGESTPNKQVNATPVKDTPAAPVYSSEVYTTTGAIPPPAGYTRPAAVAGSFAAWLRTLPLKTDKTVYLYNGAVKRNQSAQFAVVDISTGTKDLQQCADVAMRLRAEYLFSQKQYNAIAFMDYSGKWYKWSGGANRGAFDNYLQTVFGWCGSASLEKQLKAVPDFSSISAGDVLVRGGFPGHAVTVVDIAVNAEGKKMYMLVQGYQPAQDMHVLVNPMDEKQGPWYEIPEDGNIITPEWRFTKKELKRWE